MYPLLASAFVDAWVIDDFIRARIKYTTARLSSGHRVAQHAEYSA